jgi:hypothetical protein
MSDRPHLRVVRGDPTDEELAALVAVVSTLNRAAPEKPATRSAWSDRRTQVRDALPHGPGAWRSSAFPR